MLALSLRETHAAVLDVVRSGKVRPVATLGRINTAAVPGVACGPRAALLVFAHPCVCVCVCVCV